MEEAPNKFTADSLTPRMRKVCDLVVNGHDNKEIAKLLGISEQVVKNYLVRIYGTMGCKSRVQCAIIWIGLSDTRDAEIAGLKAKLAAADREVRKWRRRMG